jgi:hypothetical protein
MNVHTTFLAALGAVVVSLVVAAPSFGEPNTPPAKKGCTVTLQGPGAGQSIVHPDGYKFSVLAENDRKTHTDTCNDGKWTETVSLTAGSATLRSLTILATGAVQAVALR